MRPLPPLSAIPKPSPQPPVATCQRDLVVWSLLVCPKADKARP